MFQQYAVKVTTWDETLVDDLHVVLCDSPEHANVFIWRMESADSPSGFRWEISGLVQDDRQNFSLMHVLERNISSVDKYEKRMR